MGKEKKKRRCKIRKKVKVARGSSMRGKEDVGKWAFKGENEKGGVGVWGCGKDQKSEMERVEREREGERGRERERRG